MPSIGFEIPGWGNHAIVRSIIKPLTSPVPYDVKQFFYEEGDPANKESGTFYYWKRKYKYIMARWGYSVNIAVIEPFNEIDQMLTYRTVNLNPVQGGDQHYDLCPQTKIEWEADDDLPLILDTWLTDITDHVRGDVVLSDPVDSPLGEVDKLFTLSYAWNDAERSDRETFYKPFYNPEVDLMDAHMYLNPTSENDNEPDWGLNWAVDHTHGFLDQTQSGHFPLKPFNTGECNYFAWVDLNPSPLAETLVGIDHYFLNYDVSFHNEIWAGAFSGQFATGMTWQWERVFWWPNAFDPPQPDENNTQQIGPFSNVLGATNILDLGLDIPIPITNRRLHHHFRPLADLLAHPSWQPYQFLQNEYTAHIFHDVSPVDPEQLEAFYLKDMSNTVAIGWVHNRNAWVMNSYYYKSTQQNFLGCTSPGSSNIKLPGFEEEIPYTITWFPTRTNSPVYPPQMVDVYANTSGELELDLSTHFAGVADNYLDTLRSDYAFIVTPAPFTKSRQSAVAEEPQIDTGWDFYLFPNPARGELFLRMPDDGPKNIEIYDLSGRRVWEVNRVTGVLQRLGISHLAHGSYSLRVSDGTNSKTKKLIIH